MIPAGHNYGELISEVPAIHKPGQVEDGFKAHYFCDRCNEYFVDGENDEKVNVEEETLLLSLYTISMLTAGRTTQKDIGMNVSAEKE